MRTTDIGNYAEQAVVQELKRQDYRIIDCNWKTKVCEIDIVAKKNNVIYFVEVKYRSSAAQGDGLEYIGPQKLKKMDFAAAVWCQNQNYSGDYCLLASSVISVGSAYVVKEIIEI